MAACRCHRNRFLVVLCATAGLVFICSVFATNDRDEHVSIETIPHVVTADIKAGIEYHIEEQSRLGGGYFPLEFQGEKLNLKLVRVHMEYLANLGPRRHFACVDLASTDGNVYDVDFFLSGDPGNMIVTETTVHKLNGRPYYLWEQQDDGTWIHVEATSASRELLGVIEGDDAFSFVYQATLPKFQENARMWIPIPSNDAFQTIEMTRIEVPREHQILIDDRFGNKVLFMELEPEDSGEQILLEFNVLRQEKTMYADETTPETYLASENFVPNTDQFLDIATEVLVDKNGGDLVRARALYDHTIDTMRYAKFGNEYGKGDAVFACDSAHGKLYRLSFVLYCPLQIRRNTGKVCNWCSGSFKPK